MKEGVKKSISLILVLTLLVQLLPVVAFGVGDETNDLDISTDSETVSMKDDDAEIVGEEDALREESVKHFRLRDGGYMLVEYETAVHYQTADGSWEEIDNTLQKTGQQYVAQAGDMTRKFAASLDSGFLFETAYQGQSVSMSLARRSSRDVVAVAPDVPAAEETAAPEETAASETADQLQEAEQTEADQTQEPAAGDGRGAAAAGRRGVYAGHVHGGGQDGKPGGQNAHLQQAGGERQDPAAENPLQRCVRQRDGRRQPAVPELWI